MFIFSKLNKFSIIIISIIVIIIIIIIFSIITVFAGALFVHQPGANHAPRASVTQVNHSVYTLSTFLRIIIIIIIITIVMLSLALVVLWQRWC